MTFNGKELSDMTAKEISHILMEDLDKLSPEQRSWFKYLENARREWEWTQTDAYKHRNDFLFGMALVVLGIFIGFCIFS